MSEKESTIAQIKTFIDREGRMVKQYCPIDSKQKPVFAGACRFKMPTGATAEAEFRLPPETETIEQAFTLYDGAHAGFLKQLADQNRNQIVAAKQMPNISMENLKVLK